MNILKKRVNGTSIVLVGDKLYTRADVSDELWILILEQIDKVQSVCENSDVLADEMDTLMLLIDQERIGKLIAQQKAIAIAVSIGELEPDRDTRVRKGRRVADISGIFECDDDGMVFLKGFDHVMPKIMVDAILDAHYNPNSEYTVSSLVNFWKYLLLNPDKHVRNELFQWIKTGKFAITEDGNIISYRNVDIKQYGANQKLIDFVGESWSRIKRQKKGVKNYSVFRENEYILHSHLSQYTGTGKYVGNLHDLYTSNLKAGETIYQPQHKGPYGQEIVIGKPVSMPRGECDNDSNSSCSRGLHCKSVSYGLSLGSEVLVTLVNPYNVVAIPSDDRSKFRSCEYYPVSKAEVIDGRLVEFEAGTYDIPYNGLDSLVSLLKTTSVVDLQKSGQLSDEISESDMDSVMTLAREVIGKRVVKMN